MVPKTNRTRRIQPDKAKNSILSKNSIGIGAVQAVLLSEQPPNVPVDRHEAVVARQTASTRAFIGLDLAFLAWLGSVFPFI